MTYKMRALQTFTEYVAQYGRPKILRTDNETENKIKALKIFCVSKKYLVNTQFLKHPSKMVLQNILIEQ